MSILRTINGRPKRAERGEYATNSYRQNTDERIKKLGQFATNGEISINNRSQETIKKQDRFHTEKANAEKRIKEVQQLLTDELNSGLVEKIVASFNDVGIDETLKNFKNDLKTFNMYSQELETLQKVVNSPRTIPFFDEFLFSLAKKCPKFIPYLPSVIFTRGFDLHLSLDQLDADELKELEARFENDGLFQNAVFKSRYAKYFPSHIAELTNLADITVALSINPACFVKLPEHGTFRSDFFQNPHPLDVIVKKSPRVLKYLSNQELELYTKNFTSQLGRAIVKAPDVLESACFTNELFKKFGPKHIFSNINKTQLKPLISKYFDRFPVLEEYFNSKILNFQSKRISTRNATDDSPPTITITDVDDFII